MEKRFYSSILIPTTLAVSLALSGCGAGSKSEPSNSQPAASSSQTQPSQNTNTNQGNQATSNTDLNNQSNSQEKSQQAAAGVVSELKNKLEIKGAAIPSSFPIDEGNYLTASIDRNTAQSNELTFYQTKTPVPVNDKSLNPAGNVPVIAYFSATTYDDPDRIMNTMYSPRALQNNAQVVDLGHGIKGKTENTADRSYVSWSEGNWILQIDSLSADHMDNQGIARKMVDYLDTHALPAPKDKGRIKVLYRPGGKDLSVGIYWQDGKKIYKLETNKAPLDALNMAVSVK